eukprot:CAMPEP_0180315548 /NCGR_PEP_ID=MMETSP0988-20121125/32736_1 /TAXON_ID=697907 /ORGANISM="non described non described, Strain CCMP2293" /LENGTH=61 /DNA_ID=CAMNT_0022300491 /DNA_START=123 /DNA_END=305 /DNA_ORIENTATION=-
MPGRVRGTSPAEEVCLMLGLCPADEVRLMAGVGADAFDLAVVAGVEEPTDEQRRKYGSALS